MPKPANPRALRRKPRQERSQFTVDAILQAAAQLVRAHGTEGLTTNGVARLAGVSIGSLYQYFPGKRAILAELRRRHQLEGQRIFHAELPKIIDQPLHVAIRHFVERMIEVHRADPRLHNALENEPRESRYGTWEREVVRIVSFYFQRHRAQLAIDDPEQAAFVALTAVEAITHAAAAERPDLLDATTLVDDVVRMLLAYLTGSTREAAPEDQRPSTPES